MPVTRIHCLKFISVQSFTWVIGVANMLYQFFLTRCNRTLCFHVSDYYQRCGDKDTATELQWWGEDSVESWKLTGFGFEDLVGIKTMFNSNPESGS